MDDFEYLGKLINSGCPCISIVTHEEKEALEIVRQCAMELKRDVLLWSIGYGVRDGLLADIPAIPNTDSPETGLCHLAGSEDNTVCVTLDLA